MITSKPDPQEREIGEIIFSAELVIRGETTHYELISESTAQGLMQVSVNEKKPIGFGLIAVEDISQAKERTSTSKLNKGKEIAQSLVEMLN